MTTNLAYLYLLSPLHTGGTSQEGNLVGIAREAHTNFPYTPSSTIRGRLRANVCTNSEPDEIETRIKKVQLFGSELGDLKDTNFVEFYEVMTDRKLTQLEQGSIWIGDASILWFPVASLSHGVVWISCPLLLQRWARLHPNADRERLNINIPLYSNHLTTKSDLYLKDAFIPSNVINKQNWNVWEDFVPQGDETSIDQIIVLPNQHCETLIQMGLWRQVKVKLDEHKIVTDGSFRYEEAIPPDTLMYFPWGITAQAQGNASEHLQDFQTLLKDNNSIQIGGQESLGRGFVQLWMNENKSQVNQEDSK